MSLPDLIPPTQLEVSVLHGPLDPPNEAGTAVHIRHLPTGLTADCCTTRSQVKNRLLALERLTEALENRRLEALGAP